MQGTLFRRAYIGREICVTNSIGLFIVGRKLMCSCTVFSTLFHIVFEGNFHAILSLRELIYLEGAINKNNTTKTTIFI